MIDFVVGFGIAAIVLFIIVRSIKKARSGKVTGCGYGCSGCSASTCTNRETK